MTTIFDKLATLAAKYATATKPESIVARKSDTEATLYMYEPFTPEGFGGMSAKAVVSELNEVRGVKTLRIRINSIGGSIYEAKAIYNALKEFPGKKIVHVDGLAASAATFIAMAADEIITAPEATWMIHNAQGITAGDANAHRDTAELLDMESANIAAIYAKRTGQKEAQLREWMDAETFMTAAEAKERGFTDKIEGEEEEKHSHRMTASADLRMTTLAAETQRRIANLRIERLKSRAGTRTPRQAGMQ